MVSSSPSSAPSNTTDPSASSLPTPYSQEPDVHMKGTNDNDEMMWPEAISLDNVMESVVRITLAGLGGSMLGLSQERRLQSMRVVTGAAATAAARRKRSPSAKMTNLPLTWAISCVTFCALIETCRLTSPSTQLARAIDQLDESTQYSTSIPKPVYTVADYTLGGAMGGIASSLGRNSQLRKQLPTSLIRGNQRFFFVGPGIGLGLAAGIFQAVTDTGVAYFEQQQQHQR